MRIEEIVSANFDNFQSFFIRLIIPFSLMNTYLTSILTRVDSTLLSFGLESLTGPSPRFSIDRPTIPSPTLHPFQ